VDNHDIGVIKMEVVRNSPPENNFLHEVRKLATAKGIVLIFDECTSGFRETFGGLHKKFGVEPDMAMFGKALGNGYAVTAVIGRREIMEAAQTSFISSTFWTERIGSVAALKSLEIMERDRSWEKITEIGLKIRAGWQKLSEKYELPITHTGLPALAGFSFKLDNSLKYKTLITQEMLHKGYLAGTSVYASIEHTDSVISEYFFHLDSVFELIKECEMGRSIDDLLMGDVCHDGFKRLN
jgi:glutamate-1-semialdehyde 2,1-aminomutase